MPRLCQNYAIKWEKKRRKKEKYWQLSSGYSRDHTNRPCFSVMCDGERERAEMTHSTATYTAVDDYDNSCAALHKQLCGAALIIPDSLSDSLCSSLPNHLLCLPVQHTSRFPCLLCPLVSFFLSWLITHRKGAAVEF